MASSRRRFLMHAAAMGGAALAHPTEAFSATESRTTGTAIDTFSPPELRARQAARARASAPPLAQPGDDNYAAMYRDRRNWGRWGTNDQVGAINLITAEKRAAAASLVRNGRTVSLSRVFEPPQHFMTKSSLGSGGGYVMDYLGFIYHGNTVTHIDALCHIFVRGKMYNGVPASEVRSDGARRNSVLSLAAGVVGRGVLLDIALLRGVPFLEGNAAIGRAELEAAERAQACRLEVGDVLLVATGRDRRREAKGGVLDPADGMAGLHPECLPWLREREIALLGSDGISDPLPGVGTPNWPFPIHQIGIAGMGLHLIDNMALGELGEACAETRCWSFLFTLGVLRVPGGTGCPVNPIAVL